MHTGNNHLSFSNRKKTDPHLRITNNNDQEPELEAKMEEIQKLLGFKQTRNKNMKILILELMEQKKFKKSELQQLLNMISSSVGVLTGMGLIFVLGQCFF